MPKQRTKQYHYKLDFDPKDPEAMKKLVTTAIDILTTVSAGLGVEHAFLLIVNESDSGFTHLMTNVEQRQIRDFADVMTRHTIPDQPPVDKKPTIIVPPGTILN